MQYLNALKTDLTAPSLPAKKYLQSWSDGQNWLLDRVIEDDSKWNKVSPSVVTKFLRNFTDSTYRRLFEMVGEVSEIKSLAHCLSSLLQDLPTYYWREKGSNQAVLIPTREEGLFYLLSNNAHYGSSIYGNLIVRINLWLRKVKGVAEGRVCGSEELCRSFVRGREGVKWIRDSGPSDELESQIYAEVKKRIGLSLPKSKIRVHAREEEVDALICPSPDRLIIIEVNDFSRTEGRLKKEHIDSISDKREVLGADLAILCYRGGMEDIPGVEYRRDIKFADSANKAGDILIAYLKSILPTSLPQLTFT